MLNADLPLSLTSLRQVFLGSALPAALLLVVGGCHAPQKPSSPDQPITVQAKAGETVAIPLGGRAGGRVGLQRQVADAAKKAVGLLHKDAQEPKTAEDDFDIFEDEYENMEMPGEPFDQVSLDERVAFIVPKVEELRGQDFTHHVPAAMQSAEQFIEFAMAEFEQEYGLESFAATSEAYRLLGLIDPELDLLQTTMDLLRAQVGGYYDPKTKSFYMIDSFKQGAMADIILAHELTHALDDQRYDLQQMFALAKDNADREFAVRAVAEGSGTSLMNLFAIQGLIQGWLSLDMANMSAMMADQVESMQEAPPYLIITLALPYLEGNKLLTRQTDTLMATTAVPDPADLEAAFLNPPKSSEQVLHFEKYWDKDQLDEPTVLNLPDLSSELGKGWELEDQNVLGELGCFIMTAKRLPDLSSAQGQLSGRWTNDAATGWDGDLYQSYLGPNGQRVLHWTSIWDTQDDAEEFAAVLQERVGKGNSYFVRVVKEGLTVRAVFANAQCTKSALASGAVIPKLELTR